MTKNVLSVGQCAPDHAAICRLVEGQFDARIIPARQADDAMRQLCAEPFDLVLINRKLDADYTDGIEIIKQMKADPRLATLPVMLVTNFPEHQEQAVALGAQYGFGKLEYDKPETREKLTEYLGG